MYRLWLFSLTARCSPGTVLIGMKPEVHCTSVASVVSLFIGVGKKTWLISHFRDRVDRQPSWLLTITTLRPSRASERKTSHITRGDPTLTTDRIQSAPVTLISVYRGLTFDAYKRLSHIIGYVTTKAHAACA